MKAKADVVGLLEALYTEEAFELWVRGLLAAALPVLDSGFGVLAHFTERQADDAMRWLGGGAVGPYEAEVGTLRASLEAAPPLIARAAFSEPISATTMSERVPVDQLETMAPWLQLTGSSGCKDCIGLVGVDARRRAATLAVPLATPTRLSSPRRRLLLRIATHFAAAFRLRNDAERAEAVLGPDGRVEHAEAAARPLPARRSLTAAVRSIDRARTRRVREEAGEALDLWQGLVDGRWSLIERFERDGRRYYVARPNQLRDQIDARLSPRERQIVVLAAAGHTNKAIGYALGLGPSTVASHLGRIARKLGVIDRLELIRVAGNLLELSG